MVDMVQVHVDSITMCSALHVVYYDVRHEESAGVVVVHGVCTIGPARGMGTMKTSRSTSIQSGCEPFGVNKTSSLPAYSATDVRANEEDDPDGNDSVRETVEGCCGSRV